MASELDDIINQHIAAEAKCRRDFIAGLRELANFLEDRPGLPVYTSTPLDVNGFADNRSQLQDVVRQMGNAQKAASDQLFGAQKMFGEGSVAYTVFVSREQVCTKKVVGTREIPAQPARTEEIVQWECRAILPEDVEGK